MTNSNCVSGKVRFELKELAEESLIQHHIRNNYQRGQGPLNVYQCLDCGNWHFTSKGDSHEMFEDPEVIRKINHERRGLEWEQRLK
ncbi:hypothetical protein [Ekhidna sp.]